MRIRPESGGLEGLPLKIAIVAVVVAISSPIIYGSLRTYEMAKLEGQMDTEASAIAELAKLLYVGGPGNVQQLIVNLRGGVTASADYMLVGDTPDGAYESCIRYRVKGLAERTLLVESPNVPLYGAGGTSFKMLEGKHVLVLECKGGVAGQYIEVRYAQ
ncbi:MAG: hypothetical protein V1934_02155 [Methanobacteriota archaeon]